jgi:osmotically-inducible protein OsmY
MSHLNIQLIRSLQRNFQYNLKCFFQTFTKNIAVICVILSSMYQLTGCTGILASAVSMDRRDVNSSVEDSKIKYKVSQLMRKSFPKSNINVEVFSHNVLLTGEVYSLAEGQNAANLARSVANVRNLNNELAVGEPSKLADRARDVALTAKVKAYLIEDRLLDSGAFIVTTERSNVYLQGRVTKLEAERAAAIIRNIAGVRQVVKVLDYLSDEEFKRLR